MTAQKLAERLLLENTQIIKVWDEYIEENKKSWDNRVFLPAAAVIKSFQEIINVESNVEFAENICTLITMHAWSKTKFVYVFNAELLEELNKTKLGTLPSQALIDLPAWCIFMQLPKDTVFINEIPCVGAWVHLDRDDEGYSFMLSIYCLDTPIKHIPISLAHQTLEEGIAKYNAVFTQAKDKKEYLKFIEIFIKMAAYICSAESDIVKVESKKKLKFIRNTPTETTFWGVGERIGAAISRYKKVYESEIRNLPYAPRRPHVRKAHWHHYWTGTTDKKKLICKWLPPIPINWEWANEELPTVIHKVKK